MTSIFSWFRPMFSLEKDEDVTAYSEYLRDVKEFVDKCSKYDLFMLDCGDIVGNALSLFSSYKKDRTCWMSLCIE